MNTNNIEPLNIRVPVDLTVAEERELAIQVEIAVRRIIEARES